jgi:hypothetical protein
MGDLAFVLQTETFGLIAGFVFFLIFAGVAYVAFRILKKAAKMGVRIFVVALILLIAATGSISFWWFSSSHAPKPKPPATRAK